MIPNSARRLASLAALAAAAAFAALCVAGAAFAAAGDEPAFGDSNWVAPTPPSSELGAPDGTGPRVAEPRGEPLGESILRAPFRVAFLPLRLFVRAGEAGAGLASPGTTTFNIFSIQIPPFVLHPLIGESGAAGVSFGVDIERIGPLRFLPGPDRVTTTYSLRDNRRIAASQRFGPRDSAGVLTIAGAYDFRPNRRFYGVGNDALKGDRAIYLEEETRFSVDYRLGRATAPRVNLLASWSDVSARRGYNSSPGVLDIAKFAGTPFMLRGSEVLSVGAAGRWAALDKVRDPSRGVDLRARAEHVKSTDRSHLKYQSYHTEVRAFAPVFASRRTIALRALQAWVQPSSGSADVPFYRLPTTSVDTRFAAYDGRQFRDRHLAIGRAEYRWIVVGRLWMLGLAEVGEVAPRASALRWADIHESYGVGLRHAIDDERTARLEVARGSQGWKVRAIVGGDW